MAPGRWEEPKFIRDLGGGFYNNHSLVEFSDGSKAVHRKLVRDDGLELRTLSEVDVLALIVSATDIRVPQVLAVDEERGGYFCEFVKGEALHLICPFGTALSSQALDYFADALVALAKLDAAMLTDSPDGFHSSPEWPGVLSPHMHTRVECLGAASR